MKIVDRRFYAGPNLYALYPVARLTVDLGALDERFSNELPLFTDRLLAAVPSLRDHACCYRSAGGFVHRLETGTLMGHILEHVAIALQNLASTQQVSFGRTRMTGAPREYHVVYAAVDRATAMSAADAALAILEQCWPRAVARACGVEPPATAVEDIVAAYVDAVRCNALGPTTASLVAAAEARGIRWRRLDDRSLVVLGTGRHQVRLCASLTGRTASIAADLASDKELTGKLLAAAGLPVPRSVVVGDRDDAVDAARRIGYPVVVKPLDGNHGRGVRVALTEDEEVREAFDAAAEVRPRVMVQTHLPGSDHRLLVVDGRLIAAARRVPAHVVGDGVRDVRALIDAVNADPTRGRGHAAALTRISLESESRRLLAARGMTESSVPGPGVRVFLHTVANLSRGGTAEDVTARIHPDNARLAERAARALGLDVAGVDLLVDDIAQSWRVIGGGICEVNAAPGLRMHLAPSVGAPRDVAGPIIDMLYPRGQRSHVPIAAITGTNGKTTTARMLAHIHRCAGATVGLATTDGVYVDDELIAAGDLTGPAGARMALDDPRVDMAVLEVARGGILRRGLGFPACDVAAVLNVSADHLGFDGIDTVDEMAYVKRIVVEVAGDAAVLNADDPHVAAMARHCRRARELWWVSRERRNEIVDNHLADGGHAVVLDRDLSGGEVIALLHGDRRRELVAVRDMPSTLGGRARFNVDNAMFAAALACAGGIDAAVVGAALRGFTTSFDSTPGRVNFFDGHPFQVILDYCHNLDAYAALGELIGALDITGRRILAFGLPGNRRDDDLRAVAREAARHFDLFLVHDDDDRRGREALEVPNLIIEGLTAAGVGAGAIALLPTGEAEATAMALRVARPGDLLVRTAVDLERAWNDIISYDARSSALRQPQVT